MGNKRVSKRTLDLATFLQGRTAVAEPCRVETPRLRRARLGRLGAPSARVIFHGNIGSLLIR